jgi:hypothetical protein
VLSWLLLCTSKEVTRSLASESCRFNAKRQEAMPTNK